MPLAKSTPIAPTTLKPNIAKIASKESSSVVVDTKFTPLSSLITFVAGSSWIVDYYSQVIDKDNDLRSQDTGQSAVYQQYTLIKSMELKVTSSLTQNQNTEDKRTVVNGTATIYPCVIPNEGDMFAADIGDGREGIFRIKNSEQKSFMKQATYVIDYDLVYYTQAEPLRKKDLDAKTVRTVHFLKDFMTYGQNPLLIEEDFYAVEALEVKFHEIVQNYFNWFYNNEFKTLIVPGQLLPTYDNFIVDAVLAILTTRDDERVKHIRKLNIDEDKYLNQPQLWESLIKRDKTLLELGNVHMGLVHARTFGRNPMLEGIAYSGITYVVYPSNPDTSLNSGLHEFNIINGDSVFGYDLYPYNGLYGNYGSYGNYGLYGFRNVLLDKNITPVATRAGDVNAIIEQNVNEPEPVFPIIHNVDAKESYVLSKAFYDDTEQGKSLLEVMVNDYLDRKSISPSALLKLSLTYKKWGGLERFYYLPIVLILIRSIIRNT